jgi:hypothetical protein
VTAVRVTGEGVLITVADGRVFQAGYADAVLSRAAPLATLTACPPPRRAGRCVRGRDRGVRAGSWCLCWVLGGVGATRAGDGAECLGEGGEVGGWQPAGDVLAGDGGEDGGGFV